MKFTKMQGAGNDYIYVNCFEETVSDPCGAAVKVSDRHFGIGSDGLVLIEPSEVADFKMDIYNSDGSQAKMCGNATRCVAKYVRDNGLTDKDEISLETLSGIKYIRMYTENGRVSAARVNMGSPVLKPSDIPVLIGTDTAIKQPLNVGGHDYDVTCVSMGNPHCVVYIDDTDALDIEKTGPLFENHAAFPDRINTEFIQVISDTCIKMRVWERGAGETLACGTGACAATVSSILNGFCRRDADIKVLLRGGELTIRWAQDGDVYMTGPAETVCTGEIDI